MADALPLHNRDRAVETPEQAPLAEDVIKILAMYASEAENARRSGPSPRDETWEANWDRYWGRYDSSQKAAWQSKHVMPEAPQFVDRWAAAMREALDAAGGEWFTAVDDTGRQNELIPHVNRLMRILLARCAILPDGRRGDFTSVFEDQMKLGALMTCSAAVTWSDDGEGGGWVTVDSVDPREVWKDPKMRDLYRLRRYEVEWYELMAMSKETDDAGEPLYDAQQIAELQASEMEDRKMDRERSTGTGSGDSGNGGNRRTIVIDEWLCTLLDGQGEVLAHNALCVVANKRYLIRGPEDNPFWHGQDWLVTTPMLPVPFSVYGRSYMEDWADVADAFVELTNLILDGVFTSTLKAFAAQPTWLKDPTQMAEGLSPNMIFELAEDAGAVKDFLKEIDLGTLPPEAIAVWQALKQEMREGAKLSEIALGQVPPKGDITATEINQVSQSGSAMIRSMARTIESRFLEPVLTLVWQTALQHMNFQALAPEIGEEAAAMFEARKADFAERKIKFRVSGISALIDRQTELRALLSMLQVVGQNELLLKAFLETADVGQIVTLMFRLFGVDQSQLRPNQRETMIRGALESQAQRAEQAQALIGGAPGGGQ